jgi:hypothetical protein
MDDLKKRISSLETTINKLVKNLKKINDAKNREDLYEFSTQQLVKWLHDNEVEFKETIKDRLVDIVWENINSWEWEYYDDEEEDEQEADEEAEEEEEEDDDTE